MEVLRSCRVLLLTNPFCFNTSILVLTGGKKTLYNIVMQKAKKNPTKARSNHQVKEEMAKAQVLSAPPP